MEPTRKIDSRAISVGELFRSRNAYAVPFYQRNFAWTSEEVEQLWEDITTALDEGRAGYFLGTVVTSPAPEDMKREIVDGQQRLAVLSMLFATIAKGWQHRKDQKRADGVFRDYLGSEDRRTGEILSKLTLNELNDPLFQSVVLKGNSLKSQDKKLLPHSNRLLVEAYETIDRLMSTWLNQLDDEKEALLGLEEFVSNGASVILIEVGDESDAFVIFETLNDRGLDLAISDLVKNYLFSLAGPQIERFKKTWGDIALLVGTENLTQFLRHYWLSEIELVRERDLYRRLRADIKSGTKARQLLERLRKAADLYAALQNPEHSYWSDFTPEVRGYLEALLLFKVTQFRPVALAAMEELAPTEVTKTLRMLTIVSFRYTVISALGTGNLERIYSDAALAIRRGEARKPKSIFDRLRGAYVSDERFEADFAENRFSKPPIARYVLSEINDVLEKNPEKRVADRSGKVTLEHIMPKSAGKEWRSALPADQDPRDYTDRIGNLTLLEKGKNRGLANSGFDRKKSQALSKSTLRLNADIAEHADWTTEEIASRSQDLAKVATTVWRIDY